MKAGELFNITKQMLPGTSKRIFTKFYNMALETLSSIVRISVVEEEYTDDSFKTIPTELVRIERVESTERHSYEIIGDELFLFNSEYEAQTAVDGLKIRYWKRVKDALALPDKNNSVATAYLEMTKVANVTAGDPPVTAYGALKMLDNYAEDLFVLMEALPYLNGATLVTLPIGTIVQITTADKVVTKLFTVSPETLEVLAEISNFINFVTTGTYSLIELEDLWEEQDDGFGDEAQLASVYLAISNMSDMVGGNMDIVKYALEKYRVFEKIARIKYNTTPHLSGALKQVGF